ncbi:unnamed protein product [Miscanthus lutarioriparius]|uniref:Retrotransposon gag domain-containing protein n=1 Tax=Miscanthus lutarioriparius TaxID=422564 RepID=A0A811RDT6_9POAL|nr:unnamed protein product [Miscanthus lutarioriparius]
MDPNQKLLLDEIDKRIAARFDGLERRLDASADSSSSRLDALESAARSFDEWRPDVDGFIDDLRVEVKRLSSLKLEVGKISKYMERSMVDGPSPTPGVHGSVPDVLAPKPLSAPPSPVAPLPTVKSSPRTPTNRSPAPSPTHKSAAHGEFEAAPRTSAGTSANRPDGHRFDFGTRDGAFGVPTTLIPPPGKGDHIGKLPKFDFPKFDGDHPKLWIKQAVHYFKLYRVESTVWLSAATMHFQGPAKRWLSSIEEELENQGWDEFCAQLLSRFARDEHELLLCRLFQIRQTSPVSEYIEKFIGLVDELKAYAKHPDPLYYVQRFIDGLRDEIKAVLMVHKPATLDTACVLTELQEEALGLTKRPYRRFDQASNSKPGWGPPLALPPPPPQAPSAVWRPVNVAATTTDHKMQALCARTHIIGRQVEPDHRCSETVQLHLVQELWDILPISDDADERGPASPTTSPIS